MKRIVCILLVLVSLFSFVSCGEMGTENITCDQIIAAYEEAGYTNIYHRHATEDQDVNDGAECYIIVYENYNPSSDLAEINIFATTEQAKEKAEQSKYNLALWILGVMYGQPRWLVSNHYGRIQYSSYNRDLLEPLMELMRW